MTPFIEPEARADILRQVERYAGQGLPPIARRFHRAVLASLDFALSAEDRSFTTPELRANVDRALSSQRDRAKKK